jgi:diadenosine tetraphosphatase ApaH/serine/threonine PP2A family protein phosphatase
LPLCLIINKQILCLHGGIPEDIEVLNKLRGIKTKDLDAIMNKMGNILLQVMWNDPKSSLKGFSNSFRGAGIKNFGKEVFDNFMGYNNLLYLIRAHELFSGGFHWFFEKRLLSIFSSANYRGSNPASYALIKNNTIKPELVK